MSINKLPIFILLNMNMFEAIELSCKGELKDALSLIKLFFILFRFRRAIEHFGKRFLNQVSQVVPSFFIS